jgi:phosphoglycerol transferase MdoB-like AlkP superfamily enzyme
MKFTFSASLVRGILIGLLIFGVLSALAGTIMLSAANGGGIPLAYLEGTPFSSYLVPGLVLGVIVGGTQLAGLIGLLRRTSWALIATVVAGFGMMIWIFVEIALIRQYSDLQTVYFTLGTLELILVYALLGLAPSMVRGLTPTRERVAR